MITRRTWLAGFIAALVPWKRWRAERRVEPFTHAAWVHLPGLNKVYPVEKWNITFDVGRNSGCVTTLWHANDDGTFTLAGKDV